MRAPLVGAIVFVVSSAIHSERLHAQADSSDARAQARILLDEGNTLFVEQRYEDALRRYEAAYKLFPSDKILLNQAEAHRALGRADRAVLKYERFLQHADPTVIEAVRAQIDARLKELMPQIARVTVKVKGATGAEVTIDEVVVELGASVPVMPGLHRVAASLQKHATAVREVEVVAGQAEEVVLELVLLTSQPPPPDAFSLGDVPWWVWASVAAVVVTGMTVTVASTTGGDDFVPGGELGRSGTSGWQRR